MGGNTSFYNIAVAVTANAGGFKAQMLTAAAAVDKLSKSTMAFNQIAKTVGAGALAVGLVQAGQAAVQLEARMRNVNSLLKVGERDFKALTQSVVDLSKTVPQSANQLAEGLYEIASAGFEGAKATDVLKQSALAASAGLSETATSVRAIASVLNAYASVGYEASYVSDVLFQTVNLGIITFEELALQLGDVVGLAAAAGVGIDEVGTAMATMTLAGLQASEASTSLNRVIQSLLRPHHELRVVIEQLGFESGAAALEQLGLQETMFLLSETVDGSTSSILRLFPEIRAARGAFSLLAAEGENYRRVSQGITDEEAVRGATLKAFNEQMRSTSSQFKLLKNETTALGITVGATLLPAFKAAIAGAGTLVSSLESVALFLIDHRELVGSLAVLYAAKFVPSIISMTKAFYALNLLPLIASMKALAVQMALVVALSAPAGAGRMATAWAGLGSALALLNPVMLTVTAAAIAMGVAFRNARKQTEANDAAIASLSSTSDDAVKNIERIYDQILKVNDVGFNWADFTQAGGENRVAVSELATEFQRLSSIAPQAALDLLEYAEAQGLVISNAEGDLVGAINEAILDNDWTRGVAASAAEIESLQEALHGNRVAALDATDAFSGMGATGYEVANQMAEGLNIPIDQFIELIERAQEFEDQVRDSFTAARSIMNFDPGAAFDPLANMNLQQTLTLNVDTAGSEVARLEDSLARLDASRADSIYNIAEAERELEDSFAGIARRAEDNARAVEDANRRIADAQENLADSHKNVTKAQQDLSEAREDAKEKIEDLRESLRGQADDEERGVLAVAKARAELARASITGDAVDQREAALALRDAEEALRDTKETGVDAREELAKFDQEGVEGSERVIEARERLIEAEKRVVDAARQVADAQRDAARAVVDNADAMEQAYLRVEKAQRAVGKAQAELTNIDQEETNLGQQLATAAASYDEAVARLEDPSRGLRQFIEQTLETEEIFLTGIESLIARGLDSERITELLQAGPEAAGPIVEAMLADQTSTLIEIQNEHVRRSNEIADRAASIARITAFAQEQIVRDTGYTLQDAWSVAATNSAQGADATVASIARSLRVGMGKVTEVASAYGIILTDTVNSVNRSIGAPEVTFQPSMAQISPISGRSSVFGGALGYEEGGFVSGQRTGRDTVPAWLMPHEYVQTVDAVDHYGVGAMDAIRSKRVPKDLIQAYAGGGIVDVGRAIQGLGARVTEHPAFGGVQGRHSPTGHHYRNVSGTGGDAMDINYGPGGENDIEKAFMDQTLVPWVKSNVKNYRNLLWRVKDHFNHAHLDGGLMELAPGYGGPLASIGAYATSSLNVPSIPTIDGVGGTVADTGRSTMGRMRQNVMAYVAQNSYFGTDGSESESQDGYAGTPREIGALPDRVTRWAGVVEQALGVMGLQATPQLMYSTLRRMNQESGGNPTAINNWDINARRGTPSVGLMQVIGPTYASNKHPDYDMGPYMHGTSVNPMSNVMASMRYATNRYGSLNRAYDRAGGYAEGGLVRQLYDTGGVLYPGTTMVQNNTGSPEVVFPIDRLASHLDSLILSIIRLQSAQDEQSGVDYRGRDYTSYIFELLDELELASTGLATMVTEAISAGAGIHDLAKGMDALASVTQSAGEAMGFVEGVLAGVRPDSGVTGGLVASLGQDASSKQIEDTIAAINAMEDAWTAAEQEAAIHAQRSALWVEINAQQAAVAAAQEAVDAAANEEERAVLVDALTREQNALNEATQATIEFDRQVATQAEETAIQQQEAQLEVLLTAAKEREAAEERLAANRMAWEFDQMATEDQLRNLDARLRAEEKYTDEWMSLAEQRQQLLQRQSDELRQASDKLESELNRALDQYDALIERRDSAQEAYDERVTDAMVAMEKRMVELRKAASEQIASIRKERAAFLTESFALDQPVEVKWGNTAEAINDNQRNQMALLEQWATGIDELRSRGLSEDVIAARNLDDPANLGQVQMLLGAAQDQLENMNRLYSDRLAFARIRAAKEQKELLGAVGKATVEVQTELSESIQEIHNEHEEAMEVLRMELEEQFKEIDESLQDIGEDTGRSYAEALSQALMTGLPGIIDIARQFEAALTRAEAAERTAAVLGANPPSTSTPAYYGRSYDTGGVWPSGTYGVNMSGKDEFVLTNDQWMAMAAGGRSGGGGGNMAIQVMMDGKVIAETVTEYQHGANRRIMINRGNTLTPRTM